MGVSYSAHVSRVMPTREVRPRSPVGSPPRRRSVAELALEWATM